MLRKHQQPACNHSTLSHRNQLGYSIGTELTQHIPARATIQPVSSARKPVIVRKFTRDWCAGYASSNLMAEADLEILDNSGKLLRVSWKDIKWVCYVRELLGGDGLASEISQPERLLRKKFISRPRVTGLWLRMTLNDGDELEGIAANDRSLIEGAGILIAPPDTRSNTQRIFIPRSAIRELTVLAVIGAAGPARTSPQLQPELFPNERVISEQAS